jgi:hypothetical protein
VTKMNKITINLSIKLSLDKQVFNEYHLYQETKFASRDMRLMSSAVSVQADAASVQPVSVSVQPVIASIKQVAASVQPVASSMEPVTASIKPVSAIVQSVAVCNKQVDVIVDLDPPCAVKNKVIIGYIYLQITFKANENPKDKICLKFIYYNKVFFIC